MWGIVSYVGGRPARDVVIDAFRRMKYGGYDSTRAALLDGCGGMSVRCRALDDRGDGALVGIGVEDGEMFVGSDVAELIEHTLDAVELGQDQAGVLTADGSRPTPTRRGRRPHGSASSQTGGQKPCVWPRFAIHRIEAA
ncbi:MAG: hypothetical protein QOJ80_2933 [Mycobacterium sp.]|jgi:glucosamine 6-phosphate synthetase-like amidotransferase/phosphosugar isomerase protein|nr:hypothetical protein [Mycobacterium sp.]